MHPGRRLLLAAASATVGAACALAPLLTWLTPTQRGGHCGWTCYAPLPVPDNVVRLGGRGGIDVAPVLAVLLLGVAVLCAALVVLALRGAAPPVVLGRAITAAAFAALIWTVVVIVRFAEGGTLVRTTKDGVFSANVGTGTVVALIAAAGAVLLGGGVALEAEWAGHPAEDRADAASGARPSLGRDRG